MLASPIGRYVAGTSLMHRLDARAKACGLIVLAGSMFALSTPLELGLGVAVGLGLAALSGIGARLVARSCAPIVPFALVVALFNLLAIPGGEPLLSAGPITLGTAGAWAAVLYSVRLVIVVELGALVLLTTTPTALTDAFEALLSPLHRVGVPAHELAMILSLALRFVPILADEAQSVMDAQRARGASFETGGLLARARALGAVIVPVFAGSLRHAQNLSRALDARAYEGGQGRTRLNEPHLRTRDALFGAGVIAWLVVLVFLKVAGL